MASFLTSLERREWLLSIDQHDEALQAFAHWIDGLCLTALEMTGRELPGRHAAVIVLRLAAETEADAGTPDGPAVPVPKAVLAPLVRRAA